MAAKSSTPPHSTTFTDFDYEDTQQRLPYWARSTNPIVRRHLGLYWRTVPPELRPFVLIFGTWIVLFTLGALLPDWFGFIMISFLASIMITPFTIGFYGHVLLTVAIESSRTMQQEFANNTFELLQATPMSLPQIFLGKVAAAIWKRMDDLVMIAQLALAFGPPILFTLYGGLWPLDDIGRYLTPLVTVLAMFVLLYRLFVEPIMIGVLAVFIGIVVPGRGRAVSSAVVIGAFYFVLMFLLSRLPAVRGYMTPEGPVPPNVALVLLTDLVLPVVIPALVIAGLLWLGGRIVTAD